MIDIKDYMDKDQIEKIRNLRKLLNENPEASGQEIKTRQIIEDFLLENTSLEVTRTDELVYAYYDKGADKTIGIQSEHDAIIGEDSRPFHGCGHDGHTAIACGLALIIEKIALDKNIVFIFQPSEEDGKGALKCLYLLDKFDIDYIYGFHNFPGYEFGRPILRAGTFMCASVGMEIVFTGLQSHASEPEKAINPIYAIAKIIDKIEPLSSLEGYKELGYRDRVFATIIHTSLGNDGTYGVSPSQGKIQMTLRADKKEDLDDLRDHLEHMSKDLAETYKLEYKISYDDEFPDTSNSKVQIEFLGDIFKAQDIEPIYWEDAFRSSDDFGWYLKKTECAYFGIGMGEDALNLHHSDYEFDDRLIEIAIQYFLWIIERI